MISASPARCVQVLYTGGTIGMVQGPHGLRPASDFAARMAAALENHPHPLPAYRFTELAPPIDSATLTHAHWQQMHAALIATAERGESDAVLLLHGTDTLAYTAAALAHVLVDYPLPVVLTGAIHPADAPASDAWPNVCGALAALGTGSVRGVAVHFHGQLFDAMHVTKWHSHAADAFIALPRPSTDGAPAPLPACLHWRNPRRAVALAALPFVPGLQAQTLAAVLDGGLEALLLECYGTGTAPTDNAEILAVLRAAHERGVLLAAISQCPAGAVLPDVYAVSHALFATGVCPAGALAREAALARIYALLGAGLSRDEAAALLPARWP